MKPRSVLAVILFIAGVGLLWSQIPVAASPGQQQMAYPSPTPGPDGRIIYIVKPGDTCIELSLLYGVSVEYIRTSNLLDQNCTLREGQKLMIGMGGPSISSPTVNPLATPATPTPTPTPGVGGTAQICVLVYNDANGDALRETGEGAIAGAAISLTSADGAYSRTLTSAINSDATAYQGMCFTDLNPGNYSVNAAVPDGYNPTISLTASVDVIPGDVAYVDFGAQRKTGSSASASAAAPTAAPAKRSSPLLGIAGAAVLLFGIGLGVYAWSVSSKK